MNNNIHAWIFAKSISNGFPKNNLKALDGLPLISYSILAAQRSRFIKDVFVSTDSPDIAAVAEQYGAIVPFLRPKELCEPGINERMAWRHAIEWNRSQDFYAKMDIMVSLPMVTPFRSSQDVDNAIRLFLTGQADTVIAVTPSRRHPEVDMVYLDSEGNAQTIIPNNSNSFLDKSKLRKPFIITGSIYVSSAEFIMKCDNYFRGRVKAIEVSEENALDIRSVNDLK